MGEPIDRIISKLAPIDVALLLRQADRGDALDKDARDRVNENIIALYDAVSVSGPAKLLELINATDGARRTKLGFALRTIIIAPTGLRQATGTVGLRNQLQQVETRLASAVLELARVREEKQHEIDGLTADLELADLTRSTGDEEDEDDDTALTYLTNPGTLYITRIAWTQATNLVKRWRLEQNPEKEKGRAFVEWLQTQRLTDISATSVLRLLQRATFFDNDWIDPAVIHGAVTKETTKELLRAASVAARNIDEDKALEVSDVKREPTMTHVVYTQAQWPAVVLSLHVFNEANWSASPLDYMRWLNADERRQQLLALLSAGAPQDRESLLRGLSDSSIAYFDQVVQEAEDQLARNTYDFVPVPRQWVLTQLTDALSLIDEKLPELSKMLETEELQHSSVYLETLEKLQKMRKQLAVDWLSRLSKVAMEHLVDEAMVNDTATNRSAIVETFDYMLTQLDTVRVKWNL